jgi:MFS family permease
VLRRLKLFDSGREWTIVALLLSGVTINYIDRGSLSVAAPAMTREFGLTPTQLGWLLSAFFWTYAFLQIGAGWLVDRFSAKWIYGGAFLLWSLATAVTGLLSSFESLLLARLVLGLGESANYPACASILARNFREQQRGFANGLVDAGSKIGPALSTLIGGLIIDRYGWRALFLPIGLVSLLWLVPWISAMPNTPLLTVERGSGPSLLRIVKERGCWGTSLGMFALGYVWYFLLTWLPSYLVGERHYSTKAMATLGSLPFWGMALTSIAGGWASDRWIRTGASPTLVRKTFVAAGLLFCAAFMTPAVLVQSSSACLALLVAASLSLGIFTSNVWALTQTLAGPAAAGKWAGIQNCVGNLGGIVSPALTGIIVQKTGSFFLAFAGASVVLVLGVAAYFTLVGQVVPVNWDESAEVCAPAAERDRATRSS